MNSFSKNSLITLLNNLFVFVFGFISMIIISRVLGPEGKGIYSLILLIPGLIMTFGSFGLGSGNVYFVGSKKYSIQEVVSNSLVLTILLGSFLILVFWGMLQLDFFKNFINHNQIPSFYLWLVVITIPVSLLLSFFQEVIRGKGEIINYNKINFLRNFLELAIIVILVLVLKKGVGGAVSSYVFSTILVALFVVVLILKIAKLRFSLNKKLLKDSIIYGGKIYLANAISLLNYRLDMFLIAFFLNPLAVGIYSIAVGMSERLFLIPGAFSVVLYPKISSLKGSEANDFTPRIVRQIFFIMIVISLLLVFLAAPLIRILFGSTFLPAVAPFIILLPGIIAFGIGGVLASDLAGRGKPQYAVYSSLTCLIINIILNIILIPKWGISGAAAASAVSYWADTLVILIAFWKISKKPLSEILLIKVQDFKDYPQIFSNLKNWLKIKNRNL